MTEEILFVPAGFGKKNSGQRWRMSLSSYFYELEYPAIFHLLYPGLVEHWVGKQMPTKASLEYILSLIFPTVIINYQIKHLSHQKTAYFRIPFKQDLDSTVIINRKVMEEFSLQIKGQFQQIYKVLSKQQHDKMPFEGIQIAKSLSRIPFFRRFFDTNSEHFINLCIAQDAIEVPSGNQIYKQQANDGRQRYLYVVLQGKFSLSSEESATQQLKLLRIFGQTEILFGLETRRQRVIASEDSKVMRIKESAILKIFNKRDEIKKCLHFMDVNEYFANLKELQKMNLALSMVRRPFEKGTILKSEAERFDDVLFFIYGKVEVTTHIRKNNKEREFIIDYLEQLSTFGEYESVTGIGTPFKLKGAISGAYYSLNYPQVKRQNHKITEIIEQNAIPYPNHQELQFLEGVKTTLKTQEKRVIKSLNYQH